MSYSNGPKLITDGLVLYLDAANNKSYPSTGTSWYDLSGSGNNGSLVNGPTYNSVNKGCISFDGVDDRATVTNTIPGLSNLTIELFVYPTVVDGTQNIMMDQYLSIRCEINSNNKFNTHLGDSTSTWYYTNLPSTTTVVANTWYHIVLSRSGTNAVFYVNGVQENSTSLVSNAIGTGNITLGQHTPDTSYAWAGRMSNVKIYNIALTGAQILQNYNATKGRFGL